MGLLRTSLLVVLSCAVMSVQAANFNNSDPQKLANDVSFSFLPEDIQGLLNKSTGQTRIKYCAADRPELYEEITRYSKRPPKRIKGFNSRMDNPDKVEGFEAVKFTLAVSEAYMDAWASQDQSKQEIILDALYQWAESDALTETKKCRINKKRVNECTEWKQKDGQDLSDAKDHTTTQQMAMFLAYGYFQTLASYKPADPRHVKVRQWISKFFSGNGKPNSKAPGFQAFGFGWRFPSMMELSVTDSENYIRQSRKMIRNGLDKVNSLVLDDGSIKYGTYRGNKGLSYHHSSMSAALIAMEVARGLGLEIPDGLDKKMEKAGEVFVRGFQDHSYLDKWAQEAYKGVYTPGHQDFRKTIDVPNGNSWFYIYQFRYPQSEVSHQLAELLKPYPRAGSKDGWLGFGLGCMYAVANEVKYPSNSENAFVEPLTSPVKKDVTETKLEPIKFSSVNLKMTTEKEKFIAFNVSLSDTNLDKGKNFAFRVLVDFDDETKKQNGDPRMFRVDLPVKDFLDPSTADALVKCDKSTFRMKNGNVFRYRLHSQNKVINECALSTMSGSGRQIADRLLQNLPQIFDSPEVKANDLYGVLGKHAQQLQANPQ